MKKSYFIVIAAVLVPLILSCNREDMGGDASDSIQGIVLTDDPNEDQLSQKCEAQAKVFGSVRQADSIATALTGRMENIVTTFDENSTKVCFVTDEILVSKSLNHDAYVEMYNCYENGGVIIVTNPTKGGFVEVLLDEMCAAGYAEKILRNNIQVDGLAELFRTFVIDFYEDMIPVEYAIGEDGDLCAIAFSINGYYQIFSPEFNLTPFNYGRCADGMVNWIDSIVVKEDEAKSSAIFKSGTKGGGNNVNVVEVSKPFETGAIHPVKIYIEDSEHGNRQEIQGVFEEAIKVYVSHDTGDKKDYYLVNQDGKFLTSLIKSVPNIDNPSKWYIISKNGHYEKALIRYFKEWQSSIGLSLKGSNTLVKEASPQANNGSTTTTTSIAKCTSSSESNGFTIGGAFGASGKTPTGSISGSYSHSWTTGTSTTFTVGTSRSVSDIEVVRTTPQDSDYNISWKYTGNDATCYLNDNTDMCWRVGNLLISDMTQTNSVLFEVPGATGTALASLKTKNSVTYQESWGSILVSHWPIMNTEYRVFFSAGNGKLNHEGANCEYISKVSIPSPFRSIQTWTFSVTKFGDVTTLLEQKAINDNIIDHYLDKSSDIIVADKTDDSVASAQNVMNYIIKKFENDSGFSYKGEFVFSLTRFSDGKKITGSYVKK